MNINNFSFEKLVFKVEKNNEADENIENNYGQRNVNQDFSIDIEKIKIEEPDEISTTREKITNLPVTDSNVKTEKNCQKQKPSTVRNWKSIFINYNPVVLLERIVVPSKTSIEYYFKLDPSKEDVKKLIEKACDFDGHRTALDKQLHTKNNLILKPYQCDICKKRLVHRDSLVRHIQNHTGSRFNCHVCLKSYAWKRDLISHLAIRCGKKQIDPKEKRYTCDICTKKFLQNKDLIRHKQIHTGDKPFSCDVCSRKYSRKSTLNEHMRTHTTDKPYGCSECTSKFYQKSQLNEHMRIHTGEKPFTCNVCSQKFSSKSNLNQHMRIHTGEKPYNCDICSCKFSQQASMIRHMQIHVKKKF